MSGAVKSPRQAANVGEKRGFASLCRKIATIIEKIYPEESYAMLISAPFGL